MGSVKQGSKNFSSSSSSSLYSSCASPRIRSRRFGFRSPRSLKLTSMGNYFSCICVVNSQVVTIADLDGKIYEFRSPRPVAEIMIEFPGRIVVPADGLRNHRRVQTMRADDETKIGHFYVLFPMDRMNSRVSDEEIAVLAVSCLTGTKATGARVFPEAAGKTIAVAPKLRLEVIASPAAGLFTARLPNPRRWRPELQSINELQCAV